MGHIQTMAAAILYKPPFLPRCTQLGSLSDPPLKPELRPVLVSGRASDTQGFKLSQRADLDF